MACSAPLAVIRDIRSREFSRNRIFQAASKAVTDCLDVGDANLAKPTFELRDARNPPPPYRSIIAICGAL